MYTGNTSPWMKKKIIRFLSIPVLQYEIVIIIIICIIFSIEAWLQCWIFSPHQTVSEAPCRWCPTWRPWTCGTACACVAFTPVYWSSCWSTTSDESVPTGRCPSCTKTKIKTTNKSRKYVFVRVVITNTHGGRWSYECLLSPQAEGRLGVQIWKITFF